MRFNWRVEVSSILVRAPNWLGDAVMCLPALRALRASCPRARLTVVARPWVAGLFRREPAADAVLIAPPALAWWRLRKDGFDTAVLFTNSFATAAAARLAGIPRRIGYNRDDRGPLLTAPIAVPKPGEIPVHQRFYYLELIRRAGFIDCLPKAEPVLLAGAAEARCTGLERFRKMGCAGPVVGISPGAQNSRAKQWPPERFFTAGQRIAEALQGSVALFGSAAEHPLCQSLAAAFRQAGRLVLNLAGETTLEEFLEMAAACRVFLTNDSGAMHAAAALGVPTVAVFGPTEFDSTAPAGPVWRIVREQVECSPCMLRDCPIDHRCMLRVDPERVAQTALELAQTGPKLLK